MSEGSSTGPPTTGASTGTSEGPTSSTSGGPTSSTSSGPGSSSGSSSGGFVCDPNAVPDVLQFNYVRTVDIGSRIQASFYNIDAQEMVFLTYEGKGKRVALDGTILGDVTAPPEVSQVLDGATYDQVKGIGRPGRSSRWRPWSWWSWWSSRWRSCRADRRTPRRRGGWRGRG